MYKLYNITNRQNRQGIGFWLDKGKVYRDNIRIKKYNNKQALNKGIEALFSKGELAVFYSGVGNRQAYIKAKDGNISKLTLTYRQRVEKLNIGVIKAFIKQYGGLTIFKIKGGYWYEVYK